MEELQKLMKETAAEVTAAVFSNPRTKDGIRKIKARPVEIRGQVMLQCESFTKTQAFQKNIRPQEAAEEFLHYAENFRQIQMETEKEEYTVLISKKGKTTIRKKRRQGESKEPVLSHNRSRNYILKEGERIPYLVDLGVMTKEGRLIPAKMDKFRQINRFLEFIEDILPALSRDREITILDFGCGKSYLTFAMYEYLHERKGYDVRIIGLDLKKEVIANCGRLAREYGYEKLTFLEGDIARYNGVDHVDMVVTLHACDKATDYALAKAVGWGAEVILSVPCCQHEMNGKIYQDVLAPVMDYGLLKERFAALVTDGLRAKYLESEGYDTQILEFIDMEHTPKNILIRAVRQKGITSAGKLRRRGLAEEQIRACEEFLHGEPVLGKLLGEQKTEKAQ